jgi:hypothetical protein
VSNLTFFTTSGDFRRQEHKPSGERLLSEFSHYSHAASEIALPLDQLADYLIQVGIEQMVTSVLASQESEVLLSTILQLGRQHPEQVYGYMAEVMLQGKEIIEAKFAALREQMERRIGFVAPKKPEASKDG